MFDVRRSSMLTTIAVGIVAVAAPTAAQTLTSAVNANNVFRPERFFEGHTEGTGRLKVLFGPSRLVHVRGFGRIKADGALVLDQDIEQEGKPTKHRQWEMRALGAGRYAATLSDATGPVVGEAQGNVLRLAFPAKGGLRIRQVLVLSADGRSARNRLTIRKMGIVVATLNELIKRAD
jgi:hypothetical protein